MPCRVIALFTQLRQQRHHQREMLRGKPTDPHSSSARYRCRSLQLYLFTEAFSEMLMRDYSYQIYRSLYSCLEVTETSVEPAPPAAPETSQETNEAATDNHEEQTELMITSGDDAALPALELTADESEHDESGKKRKRSPSKVESTRCTRTCPHMRFSRLQEDNSLPAQRKKSAQDENKDSSPKAAVVQTRPRTIRPELLLAFTFFDRNRCGYLIEKDLEEILLLSGLSLTKNEVDHRSSHRTRAHTLLSRRRS